MRKAAIIVTLLLLTATQAQALQVRQVDTLSPGCLYTVLSATYSPAEVPTVNNVAYEVYHLQTVLPFLTDELWPVSIISQRCSVSGKPIAGCVWPNRAEAFVFSTPTLQGGFFVARQQSGIIQAVPAAPYLTSYAVAHEVGHLTRFQCVSDSRLREYAKLRNAPAVDPEELFAEDFRMLFGSDLSRRVRYQVVASLPGPDAREFILNAIGEGR